MIEMVNEHPQPRTGCDRCQRLSALWLLDWALSVAWFVTSLSDAAGGDALAVARASLLAIRLVGLLWRSRHHAGH